MVVTGHIVQYYITQEGLQILSNNINGYEPQVTIH